MATAITHDRSTSHLPHLKSIVHDLFTPSPQIYWLDFLGSILIGWGAFSSTVYMKFSWISILTFLIASLALYRAVIFVHELTHLKKGTFRWFHIVWNLLCGFPLLVPSFLYMSVHLDHHKLKYYGTKDDKEYAPFALENPTKILKFISLMFLAPILFIIRFLVATPLSYLIPSLRKPLWEFASSLAVGSGYQRPLASLEQQRIWWIQEFLTFAYAITAVLLVIFHILPFKVLILWYCTATMILLLNAIRTLAAHRYLNPPNRSLNFIQQFLDSVNIPGGALTSLWAPVGLRFHATHHLFSNMPYHQLRKAHERLTQKLPKDHFYFQANQKSLWSALNQLWTTAIANQKVQENSKTKIL